MNTPKDQQSQENECSDTWTYLAELEVSPKQPNNLGEYEQLSLWKSTPMHSEFSDTTSQISPSTQTSETTTQSQENSTLSQWDGRVQAHQTQELSKDSNIQPHHSGEKDLDVSLELRPKFCIMEQPEGFIRRGLRTILASLYMAGYSFEVETVSASSLGSGQQRHRLFIISYPDEWADQFKNAPCWSSQMREMVQRQRADSVWLSVRNTGDQRSWHAKRDRSGNGLSVQLVRGTESRELEQEDYIEPNKTPGRIRARYLAGRTVTPAQAAVALRRVLYLDSLSG